MRVRRTLAALLAAPCLLSACGGGSSVADPPVSSHPTSSAPTTQPPESPRVAVAKFSREWAKEDTRMQNSGETRRFRQMSLGCQECKTLADRIETIYAAGGFVRTKGWHVLGVDVRPNASDAFLVNLRVRSSPTHYRERRDGPRLSYPGGVVTYQLTVSPSSGSWAVRTLGRMSS
jgi:hypothetical protein